MTSKEALERLKESLEDEVGSFGWINELYGIVLKDLERLEALEEENRAIKSDYDFWCKAVESAELPKLMCEIGQLKQENEKLKKAIEILKDKLEVFETINSKVFNTQEYCILCNRKLTQQEYELLKEVLGNE